MNELFPTRTEIFKKNAAAKTRYVFNQGGTSSSKTYSILQVIFLIGLLNNNRSISVVSESMPHIKRGAFKDFKDLLLNCGYWHDNNFNKTDHIYKINDSAIEFFGADSSDKVHGPRRDYLYVNEIQNIPYETFYHLAMRTKKRIFADYNPTSEFWVHENFLNNPSYKEKLTFIHSTYQNNEFLDEQIKQDILSRAEKDENFRRVYIEGLPGVLEGLIYPKITLIDSFPENTEYVRGLDFGYSNNPSALIKCAKINDNLYFDEEIYQKGMSNTDISRLILNEKLNDSFIWADSEDPKSIAEIKSYGINISGADKPKGSVDYGIQLVKRHNIYVTKRSTNLIKEFRNYKWQIDKNGIILNVPVKLFDHGMDALRYAIFMTYGDYDKFNWWVG